MYNLQVMRWNRNMLKSFIAKAAIAGPIIRPDGAAWLGDFLYKLSQTISRCVFEVPESNSPNSFSAFILHGNTDQSFTFSTPTAFSRLFPTDIGFINFNNPGQSVTSWTNHCSSKFMEPLPGGIITPKVKYSLKPKCISSVLLTCNVPHSPKPKRQGLSGAVKNCTGSYRRLISTISTMKLGSFSSPRGCRTAMRATEAFGPSKSHQIVSASSFRAKSFFKFYQRSGVIFLHRLVHYMLWPLESSAYPSYFYMHFPKLASGLQHISVNILK